MIEKKEKFGKYLLLEKLNSGGMAEVYLAKSTGASGIAKFVAVKRILPQYSDNPEYVTMFTDEAKIAVNLNHSNIVSYLDFGIENRQLYLVMEYVEGRNLRQILNKLAKSDKHLTLEQSVYVVKEAAAGLDHAHRCLDGSTGKPLNIIHRDMSPQNIMASFEGEIRIIDFGIAKAESQLETTRAGTFKGKFGYMSPEQAEGLPIDYRTDIFSLGIVLWELLANERLFAANNEIETLRKIRTCHIPSLKKNVPNMPQDLERICNRALAKDRGLRYQSCAEFHKDLNRFLNVQFPDFSVQDFSLEIKSYYADVVNDNRQKLVEYAKIESIEVPPPEPAKSVTNTDDPNQTLKINNTQNDPLDIKGLKENGDQAFEWEQEEHSGPNEETNKSMTAPEGKSRGSGLSHDHLTPSIRNKTITITQSHRKRVPVESGSKLFTFSKVAPLLIIIATGFGYIKRNEIFRDTGIVPQQVRAVVTAIQKVAFESEPKLTNRPVTNLSPPVPQETSYGLFIMTEPPGASLYINGELQDGVTPIKLQLAAQQQILLSIRKEGYLPQDKDLVLTSNQSLTTTMIKARMGYIDLNIMNGGNNPIVFINGQRIVDKLPLRKYAVPADTQLTIRVENPFARTYDETKIIVPADGRVPINLIPINRKVANDSKKE